MRLLVISDLHCGHRAGLTPPEWWDNEGKYAEIQKTVWKWYADTLSKIKPVDVLVINGDAIDGKGEKSGSTEVITADRKEQCEIATECINLVGAEKIYLTYGTGYHTGKEEDWEAVLSDMVSAKGIHSHLWLEIGGVNFDFKHKVSSSIIPHGRHTGPSRDKLWNLLWAEKGL